MKCRYLGNALYAGTQQKVEFLEVRCLVPSSKISTKNFCCKVYYEISGIVNLHKKKITKIQSGWQKKKGCLKRI